VISLLRDLVRRLRLELGAEFFAVAGAEEEGEPVQVGEQVPVL
jgi:hypothetical protein